MDYRFHGSKRQTYKRQQRPLLRDGHLRLPPAWLVRDLGKRNFGLGHYGTRLSALSLQGGQPDRRWHGRFCQRHGTLHYLWAEIEAVDSEPPVANASCRPDLRDCTRRLTPCPSLPSQPWENRVWRVDFWSVPQFNLVRRLQGIAPFSSVAFAPDSQLAYLASGDQSIAVYDLTNWARVRTLHGHRDEIWCIALSSDGRWLASGSRDQTIRFWSTAAPPEAAVDWPLSAATREVYLADDGQTLATVATNDVIRVWAISNLQSLAEWPIPFTKRIRWSNRQWTQVAVAPRGTQVALGGEPQSGSDGPSERLVGCELTSNRRTFEYQGLHTWPAGLAFSTMASCWLRRAPMAKARH